MLKNTIVATNRKLLILLGVSFLIGCTSLAEQFARKAALLGMKREVVTGMGFQHVLYINNGSLSKTLHIYLDGDGTPWIAGRPSNDPTPRNPMVLKLMAQDKSSAVYLGRPCYHGVKSDNCSSHYWLEDRYSQAVIDSLVNVVKQLLEQGGYEKVSWFGHSGGGVLAVLLASRLSQKTIALVTVAANLDLDAWAVYYGHDYVSGSLNPMSLSPLPRSIYQRHYAGKNDTVVPPLLMGQAVKHLGSELILIDNYDHVCCWEQIWPTILDDLVE